MLEVMGKLTVLLMGSCLLKESYVRSSPEKEPLCKSGNSMDNKSVVSGVVGKI